MNFAANSILFETFLYSSNYSPHVRQAMNASQSFNRKSISRSNTLHQSLNL